MVAEEVFCKLLRFHPITSVKKGNFQGFFKLSGAGPEPQFGFAAPGSRSRKKYLQLHNTAHNHIFNMIQTKRYLHLNCAI
jgi:hypothetical protein